MERQVCILFIYYQKMTHSKSRISLVVKYNKKSKTKWSRAAVDGTPSQIPAFFTYNLYLGVKVTQNVAQYLLHNVTYAPLKFEVDMSNG